LRGYSITDSATSGCSASRLGYIHVSASQKISPAELSALNPTGEMLSSRPARMLDQSA
jgi:hypothetical protein